MNLSVSFVKLRAIFILTVFLFFNQSVFSQSDSLKQRKIITATTLGTAYVGSMAGLYQLWYSGYPQSSFHFFNDNREWLYIDKVGHVFSAYILGKHSIEMLKWAGFSDRQANIAGPMYGYLYQTTIEVFDGFSQEWGFSMADMAANTLGTGLVMSQALVWNEQRITMKFSFAPTPFAEKRPHIMGHSLLENVFKDYNGQTYWLCVNPKSFAPQSKWPDWLDISLGYGATGMYGGHSNTGDGYDFSSTPRRMEFYLAPDINLDKLRVKKKWIKYSLKILNTFKFPLPAINYTQGVGLKFETLKF